MSVRSSTTPSMDQALLQQALLPPHRRPNVKPVVIRSTREKVHCWLTAVFALAAVGSLAGLLMLTPLWAEPAWASLTAGLQANPVTCVTDRWEQVGGVGGHCAWTSCRQGCTSEIHRCHHVYVNVSLLPWGYTQLLLQKYLPNITTTMTSQYFGNFTASSENTTEFDAVDNVTTTAKAATTTVMTTKMEATVRMASFNPKRSADNPRINQGRLRGRNNEKSRHAVTTASPAGNSKFATTTRPLLRDSSKQIILPANRTFLFDFTATNVRLMINIKGCGYPPEVTCSDFLPWVGEELSVFPCYVSPLTLNLAVVQFNPAHSWFLLITCFVIPATLFVLFVFFIFLLKCHCNCKYRRGRSPLKDTTPSSRPWRGKLRTTLNFGRQRYYEPGDDSAFSGNSDSALSNWAKLQQWAKGHLPNRQRVASNGIWSTKLPHSTDETLKLQVVRLA